LAHLGPRLARWVVLIAAVLAAMALTVVPASAAPTAPATPSSTPAAAAEPDFTAPARYRNNATGLCMTGAGRRIYTAACNRIVDNVYTLQSPGCCAKGWWITPTHAGGNCLTVGPNIGDAVRISPCAESSEMFFGLKLAPGAGGAYTIINHPGPNQPQDKCLAPASSAVESPLVLVQCNPTDRAQQWTRI
jgi:hypothetical protein